MINSSLGTTKRGISLGDSKYLLLYLYGVPDFEEPANHHDSSKGVVYGYRHIARGAPQAKSTSLRVAPT